MKHEDGHCDACGAELRGVAQLTISGHELCQTCAAGSMVTSVRVASKPEARDDGR